jgi:hypothetical protein
LKPSHATGRRQPAVLYRRFIVPLIQVYREFTTKSRVLIIGNDIRAVLLKRVTQRRVGAGSGAAVLGAMVMVAVRGVSFPWQRAIRAVHSSSEIRNATTPPQKFRHRTDQQRQREARELERTVGKSTRKYKFACNLFGR